MTARSLSPSSKEGIERTVHTARRQSDTLSPDEAPRVERTTLRRVPSTLLWRSGSGGVLEAQRPERIRYAAFAVAKRASDVQRCRIVWVGRKLFWSNASPSQYFE